MRTIPNIFHQLKKIDELILTKFIPAITGGIYVNPVERDFLSLHAKYGGLGLPIFSEIAGIQFQNSQIRSEDLQTKLLSKNEEAVNNMTRK